MIDIWPQLVSCHLKFQTNTFFISHEINIDHSCFLWNIAA